MGLDKESKRKRYFSSSVLSTVKVLSQCSESNEEWPD